MEHIGLGFELMVIGMATVFIVLCLVIYLGKGLIAIVNRFPEEVPVKKSASAPATAISPKVKAVIDATVSQLTGGKGHVTNITKL